MKILAFAGREHHFLRLLRVGQELAGRGHEFKFICSDNAYNVDPATEYLIPSKAPYLHLLDFLLDTKVVGDITNKLLAEIVKKEPSILEYMPANLVAYSVRELAEVYTSFIELLNSYKPDAILILHENNFWTKVIAYICKERGVFCAGFQEGLLRHRDQDSVKKQSLSAEYVNRLFVWSKSDEDAYERAGIEITKLRITGIPHLDDMFAIKNAKEWDKFKNNAKISLGFDPSKQLVTFSLPLLSRYEGNPTHAIEQVVGWCLDSNIPLNLKLHPFESKEVQMRLEADMHGAARVTRKEDFLFVTGATDLMLSQHSTAVLEALALDVPVVEVDFSGTGVLQSFADQGVAFRAASVDDLYKIARGQVGLDLEVVTKWKEEHIGPTDGKASERVALSIEENK